MYIEEVKEKFHRLFNVDIIDNLSQNNIDNDVAIILVDLAPYFNMPKNKIKFVNIYLDKIYQHLTIYNIYYTHIYKQPINKKVSVENDESVYNAIVDVTKEIEYLIGNILLANRALIINLGRYKEYSYLNRFLYKYYNEKNISFKFMNIKHYSNYSKNNYDLNDKNFWSDIKQIKKNINYLENNV